MFNTFVTLILSYFVSMLKSTLFLFILSLSLSSAFSQALKPISFVKNGQEYVFGIADLKDVSDLCVLKEQGMTINSINGDVITFQIPANRINHFTSSTYFHNMVISNIKNSSGSQNFTALKQSKVDKVNQGTANQLSSNYSGKGVIIGIVDIGFQTDHPTFFSSDGKQYRVSRFWDQTDQTGTAPTGFNYGKECADSLSIISQIDNDGSHGTHVAGIASGSGYTSTNLIHKGVAHEAELVFVKILHTNDSLGKSALGDAIVANPTIIDAYNYIFNYAKAQGKPAVINLSWGSHTGPHDGTSLFDRAVEQMVAEPGHVVIGANGNNGRDEMHFRHDFSQSFDTIRTIPYERSRGWRSTESVYVDIWGSANKPFQMRAHFYDSAKNKLSSTPLYNTATAQNTSSFLHSGTDTLRYTIEVNANYTHNQKPNILFYSKHPNPKKYFVVLEFVATDGRLDAWNSGDAYRWGSGGFSHQMGNAKFGSTYKKGDVTHTMGENGGTGKGTISVGAYINRDAWVNFDGKLFDKSNEFKAGDIAGFSSEGPTVDGRLKPDISSPGQGIISSINRHAYNPNLPQNRTNLMDSSNFDGTANYWLMQSGTSMAAPQVCGIVALMLEANPHLTSSSIRNILQETAVQDSLTGNVPNMKWGHGKVDALAALKEAEKSLAISNLSEASTIIFPNPASNEIHIQSNIVYTEYIIHDLKGAEVSKGSIQENQIDLLNLTSGLYMLRLIGPEKSLVKQIVISFGNL